MSNTGTWGQRVAQDWLILELTHGSGMALGITTGLQFLPLLLFGLWGGVIADRYRKRRVLMGTQVAMGLVALVLGVLAMSGSAQAWHVYGLAFALGLVTVIDNPARQSFAIEMVGKQDLPNAIALNSAIFQMARVLGPATAGLLIAATGSGPVFLVNAASYGAVLAGLALMRERELHTPEPVPREKGQLREGLRYVRKRRDLMLVLFMVGFVAAFGMNFQITTSLMAREVFDAGASGFGFASAMFAVGGLAGALMAARRARPSLRLLTLASLFFGVLLVATGLMPNFTAFLILLVPTGMAILTFSTAANALMQLDLPAEMRGRVMGLYMLVFIGTTPIGAPIVGWLAGEFGPRASLVASGLVCTVATVVIVLVMAARPWRIAVSVLRSVRLPARLGQTARA